MLGITSIIQIATSGSRLGLQLNAEACQLVKHGIDIHIIPQGVSLFALTLKNAGRILGQIKLHPSPLSDVVEFTWEIAQQAQLIFIDMKTMVDRLQSSGHDKELKRVPIGDRVKWFLRKRHINYLLACLECFNLNLIIMIQVLQLAQLISTSSRATPSDDEIAQEKAEIQTMMVNLYWSSKRLYHLWDLAELDAQHATQNSINHRINQSHPRRIHQIHNMTFKFWRIDLGLGDLEKSPEIMRQLSERAMNRLFSHWLPLLDTSRLHSIQKSVHYADKPHTPHIVIPSDSENDFQDLSFDGHGIHPTGTTNNRRKPQSQQARHEAAEVRQSYSGYQAHVKREAGEGQHRGSHEARRPQRTHTFDEERRASVRRSLDSRRSAEFMPPYSATDGNPVHYYHDTRRTPRHRRRHSTPAMETRSQRQSPYRSVHRSPSRSHHYFHEERRERHGSLRTTVGRWLRGVLHSLL
ncbi:uncharacterized protein N7483_010996 [Penicillium malachiteum]|uniref:uncharacterized protein n=1 Tax=Penicillium malachiteum TaxID=1324776 RepID=UPI0025476324|nr:uncharacterized protein N7483_010996 [Penicillium malachiteum]KAJ5713815.1 hypothetical protein N7483_010996 [Penicillium malachiteum]